MSLTNSQRNLAALYHCDSRSDTIAQLREALPDVDEPDILADLLGAVAVLESMSDADFDSLGIGFEEGCRYSQSG